MYDMTVIKQNGGNYIDSREVAEVIGKEHRHLLRDIRGYVDAIEKRGAPNFGIFDFFIESSYLSAQNKEMPCYLLSKMACELVANKLTGEKGVLFTCPYVTKFNEMERRERAELETLIAIPTPRLGEINACTRIVVRGLKNLGATAEQIMGFLKGAYEPFGIIVDALDLADIPQMYTAKQIAKMYG